MGDGRALGKRPRSSAPPFKNIQLYNRMFVDQSRLRELTWQFHNNATIKAAFSVLHSRLFSGGLQVRYKGEAVDAAGEFTSHIDTVWARFATDVLEQFLVGGFCAVTFVEQTDKRTRDRYGPLIPHVIPYSKYQLGIDYSPTDEFQYAPIYNVYPQGQIMNTAGTLVDNNCKIFMFRQPTTEGEPTSDIASCSQFIDFIQNLIECAGTAESLRSRPAVVTQRMKKPDAPGVQSSDMFYDMESQEIHAQQENNENIAATMALKMQAAYAQMLNRSGRSHENGRLGVQRTQPVPEVASRIFALPIDQAVAPVQTAESRNDLVALINSNNEMICCAMGVPASLVFESRFASRTTAQMSLFNATIQQLTLSINEVLTECYLHIYGRQTFGSKRQQEEMKSMKWDDEGNEGNEGALSAKWGAPFDKSTRVELVLLTSPLSATEEIINVYTAGLADFEIAAPMVLSSIGASSSDVLDMMSRFKAKQSTMSVAAQPKEGLNGQGVRNTTSDAATSGNGGNAKKTNGSNSSKKRPVGERKDASGNNRKSEDNGESDDSKKSNDKKDEGDDGVGKSKDAEEERERKRKSKK